ncbi:hypothetical protein V6N12_049202 [Hibiscus sabdariffa]|uniref:Uncharacterized protein n=1 Tax=Hibiscus sabdariffa TaxID=183260 RepID=A0ABR2EJH6_9ROSI
MGPPDQNNYQTKTVKSRTGDGYAKSKNQDGRKRGRGEMGKPSTHNSSLRGGPFPSSPMQTITQSINA